MDAVRRLLGLAAHLRQSPPIQSAPRQTQDTLEYLRELWCVPWRPLQNQAQLDATAGLLVGLRPLINNTSPPDQVQLVVRILYVCCTSLAASPPSYAAIPGVPSGPLSTRRALLSVVEAAAALLVPWAAELPCPIGSTASALDILSAECLASAALASCDVATSPALPAVPSPSLAFPSCLLIIHAARVHACAIPTAMDRLTSLWSLPPTASALLSPPHCSAALSALLDLLPQTYPEAQGDAVGLAIGAIGRVGPSLAMLDDFVRALSGKQAMSPRRLELALQAVSTSLRQRESLVAVGVACVAAPCLLMHEHREGPVSEERTRVWREMIEATEWLMRPGARDGATEIARAAAIVALGRIGIACRKGSGLAPGASVESTSACLSALLRLVLEDLAHNQSPLMSQVRDGWVQRGDGLSSALVGLYEHSSGVRRAQALSSLRSFGESMADAPEGGEADQHILHFMLQVFQTLLSSSVPGVLSSPTEAVWVIATLSHLATRTLDTVLEAGLLRALDALARLVESQPDETMLTAVRESVLRDWAQLDHSTSQDLRVDRRRAFLLTASCALCLQARRPAPYPAVSSVVSRLLTAIQHQPATSIASRSAHHRLRGIVANPRVLAYRAGPSAHWDEARRRVLVSYVKTGLESFPERTSEQDLAYCVGAAIGGLPHDAAGQSVLLACLSLIKDRAHELWTRDPECRSASTIAVTKLLYQALILFPPRTLKAGLQCTSDFVASLDSQVSRRGALAILRDILGSDNESIRQAELVKWYLLLVDRLVKSEA